MRTLKLTLAYDGSNYCGWQIQPNGPTIQEELEKAIASVTREKARPTASGRTDSGVHALAQVAHVRLESKLSCAVLRRALNANLPEPIRVLEVNEASDSFHAIRDAKWKLYRYVLQDGPVQDIFQRAFSWWLPARLDHRAMDAAAQSFMGTHDFRCFETEWPNRSSSIRTVRHCRVSRFGDFLYVDAEADGFLYNMVRAITGTLVEIGRGKEPVDYARAVIAAGDRRQAGPTAPPQGLFLVRVIYDEEPAGAALPSEGSGPELGKQ